MAADLGLVAHAADRDALELAPHRGGDRAAERRLADAGRADEAEDRAARVRLQLAHREELEDAVLDLLDVVVVAVEHLARVPSRSRWSSVDFDQGSVGDPLEVAADHAVLGRLRRQPLEARQLALGLLRGRPRAGRPPRSARAARRPRPAVSSTSPSSSWIAFSCWRRKNSRWPLSDLGLDLRLDLRCRSRSARARARAARTAAAAAWRRRAPRAAPASPRS